jgi:hypothetical protein
MNWLARLKNVPLAEEDATKAIKPLRTLAETSFVGSVAPTWVTLEKIESSAAAMNDPVVTATDDQDRWCYPHSTAMNKGEIENFMARLSRFTTKGLTISEAEVLADKLVTRDREQDDRRFCLECSYLAGYGSGSWRCSNWQAAGIAILSRDAHLPADFVSQLQRCDRFTT